MRTSKATRGQHHADEKMAVLNLTRNRFYILFPAKGIVSYKKIISSLLYVRLKGIC